MRVVFRFLCSHALRGGTLRRCSKGSQGYTHYGDSNNNPLSFHSYSSEGVHFSQPSVGHGPTECGENKGKVLLECANPDQTNR